MAYKKDLHALHTKGLTDTINGLYDTVVVTHIKGLNTLPAIEIKAFDYSLTDETLNKREQKWGFGYEINIYAQDKDVVIEEDGEELDLFILAEDILDELEDLVLDYFNEVGLTVLNAIPLGNQDPEILRRFIRVNGVYDETKNIVSRG